MISAIPLTPQYSIMPNPGTNSCLLHMSWAVFEENAPKSQRSIHFLVERSSMYLSLVSVCASAVFIGEILLWLFSSNSEGAALHKILFLSILLPGYLCIRRGIGILSHLSEFIRSRCCCFGTSFVFINIADTVFF